MSYDTILYSVSGGVATLTLNRPDKLNSFNRTMHEEIQQVFKAIASDSSVRVLVIKGAGRGFCAGQDLSDPAVQFNDAGEVPDFEALVTSLYKPLILNLRALNVPTIAAVNGVAAGAGASLALACDLVIASKSAAFIQAFSQIGLIPDTGGTWFLPRLVGSARAMGLALLAEKLSAEEAEAWGLIWRAVDEVRFEEVVAELAHKIATMPTKALVEIRHLMERSTYTSLEKQLDDEARAMGILSQSDDYREGVTAFVEKRKPSFKGV